MSLTKEVLRITARFYPMGYKTLYEHIYDETTWGKKLNKKSLRVTLSRLKKNGLLAHKNEKWTITQEGRELLSKQSTFERYFLPHKELDQRKNKCMIVIFDIPEKKRRYRDWLRTELVSFGFEPIQKSAWFGPALPKEFIEHLKEVGILKYLRFFRATENDLI